MDNKKKFLVDFFHGSVFYLLLGAMISGGIFGYLFYAGQKNTEIEVVRSEALKKDQPIYLIFSSGMLKDSVTGKIEIEPQLNFEIAWEDDRRLAIIPQEDPIPETEYTIAIRNSKTRWLIPTRELSTSIFSEEVPTVSRIEPTDQATEVDWEQPIRIYLDRPLQADHKLEVSISPYGEFEHQLDEKRQILTVKPKGSLEKDSKYSIKVRLKHQNIENYQKELAASEFHTKKPVLVVYSFDAEGKPLKTEERKEEIKPEILEGRYIHIDISSQTLGIFEDGQEKGLFKISSGLRGMDTPIGDFKIMSKGLRPWSARYKLYMPYFMQFTGQGHGIHELPEWPGGYKEGANHLGIPVSHGCVRLGIGPAKLVYEFTELGTPLLVRQ